MLDKKPAGAARLSALMFFQLVQLFMGGVSALVGNLLAGALGQIINVGGRVDYRGLWMVSWAAALGATIFVWLLFKEDRNQSEAPV